MTKRNMDPVETFRAEDPDYDMVTASRRLVAYQNRQARRQEGSVVPSPRNPDRQRDLVKTGLAYLGAVVVGAGALGLAEAVSHKINGTPGQANPAMTSNPYAHNVAPKPNALTIDGPTSLPPQDTPSPSPDR